MADNFTDDDSDLRCRIVMSYGVGRPEQEYNHWRSVGASDRKLGKPEPYRTRRTKENNICNLTKVLKNGSLLDIAVHLR